MHHVGVLHCSIYEFGARQDLPANPNCCAGLKQVGAPSEAGSKPLGTVILLVLLLNPKHDMSGVGSGEALARCSTRSRRQRSTCGICVQFKVPCNFQGIASKHGDRYYSSCRQSLQRKTYLCPLAAQRRHAGCLICHGFSIRNRGSRIGVHGLYDIQTTLSAPVCQSVEHVQNVR